MSCNIVGCGRPVKSTGLCNNHYMEKWRKNNPDALKVNQQNSFRKRYAENPDKIKGYQKVCHAKMRLQVFEGYGGSKCRRCGITDTRCLSLDHINNDGAAQRKELGRGTKFYYWLKRNNFPAGIQVLCMNCQWIKRNNNGILPPIDG